jgi:hypothetical protein
MGLYVEAVVPVQFIAENEKVRLTLNIRSLEGLDAIPTYRVRRSP